MPGVGADTCELPSGREKISNRDHQNLTLGDAEW